MTESILRHIIGIIMLIVLQQLVHIFLADCILISDLGLVGRIVHLALSLVAHSLNALH